MPRTFSKDALRVYLAGPLFNRAEREEMTAIANVLDEAGYCVFLPHRDGMEFRLVHQVLVNRGWPAPQAAEFLHAAIFALDVYQLAVRCDAVVWNLNGRTPDEGAVSEAAIAWTLGKPVVAYRDDVRSLIAGRINPLLAGLVDFQMVEEIDDVPDVLSAVIARQELLPPDVDELPANLRSAIREGQRLWSTMTADDGDNRTPYGPDDELIADAVADLFARDNVIGDTSRE